MLMSGAKQVHMFHLPMFRIGRYDPQPEYVFFKRLFDLAIAGAATIVLSPIMIITAIAIKAYRVKIIHIMDNAICKVFRVN